MGTLPLVIDGAGQSQSDILLQSYYSKHEYNAQQVQFPPNAEQGSDIMDNKTENN